MKSNIIEFETCAKINLHLEITGRLENGYHEIFSVFQLISLSDKVEMIVSEKSEHDDKVMDDGIEINGNFTCTSEENLIYKTILEFEKKAQIRNKYIVNVEKKIPDGGGLGGGSGNSAFVLYYLNNFHDKILDDKELIGIAEKIGSDVPFFLTGNTAVVEGRGEVIRNLDTDLSNYTILVVNPGFRISTKEAYELYDKSEQEFNYSLSGEKNIHDILNKPPEKWNFYNSFTPVLMSRYREYSRIFRILSDYDSSYSNITGSGSSVFGVFTNQKSAENAGNKLRDLYPFIWIGNMLAGKPLLEK